jgi:SAM-dependent methyltransferase
LGFDANVPGNVSRYFSSRVEATSQPSARVEIVCNTDGGMVSNRRFREELVLYDLNYLTSVSNLMKHNVIPTLDYLQTQVLSVFSSPPKVLDIGCGQGELVAALTEMGLNAYGFDTVLRHEAPNLSPTRWRPGLREADLFVMRCVLPHIENPFVFLDDLFRVHPLAKVLVEYQNLNWIFANSAWNQISHDHVNIFQLSDFEQSFTVDGAGKFAEGEWEWVLLSQAKGPSISSVSGSKSASELAHEFKNLSLARDFVRSALGDKGCEVVVWGAAGKGATLAHALVGHCSVAYAVDADPSKHGYFMETSGVEVRSPEVLQNVEERGRVVILANPSHFDSVNSYLRKWGSYELITISSLLTK